MKKLLTIALLVFGFSSINAQGYMSFYQLRDIVPQTQGLQPAFIPDNSLTISMPALNAGVLIQGDVKLQELFSRPNGQAGLTVDFDLLNSVAQAQNFLNLDITSNIFHLGLRTKYGAFS